MKGSIHAARFLDIGVDEKLNATVPWHYEALDEQQRFATFDQAFEHYEGRVLLLGTPGSGKTTTLHNLALKLISEAQQEQTAPIPLLFNLSKFSNISPKRVSEQLNWLRQRKEPSEENPARVFEQWLIQMLVEMPVEGLNKQTAQQWINSGEIALLLDGLDEVNDSYVLSLTEIMNQTYFREHPLQTVVVCSRIIEYQPLQENKEARLRLNGAVILQPPTREQIDSYLEAAQALALRDALRDDVVLYEMAQTPLTLSMMTLAYGGQAPTDIQHDLPFLDRRRELLDIYVERMVQRTARREQGVPFDLNPDNDVPPRYPLHQTNHYLGWLAIKLSERMRTLFPLGRLYSFFSAQPKEAEARSVAIKNSVAMIAAWLIAVLTNAGLLMQEGWAAHWLWLTLIPLLAPLTVSLVALDDVATRWEEKRELGGAILSLIFFAFCFGLVNQALRELLPLQTHPAAIGVIVLALCLYGIYLSKPFEEKIGWERVRSFLWRLLKLLFALTLAATIAAAVGRDVKSALYGIALASYVIVFFGMRRSEFSDSKFWQYALAFVLISAGVVAVILSFGWLIGSRGLVALAVAITILFGLLFTDDKWVGTPLSLALAVVLGHLVGGPSVAVLAAVAVFLLYLVWLKAQTARAVEWLLLNPLLRVMLPLVNKTCFRYRSFLDYAADTMLLKHVGTEYEFVHRLLRDHFAIRELIPALSQAEGEKRIAIIQRLSRQGDSSFDALANLTTHSDSLIRRAAIEGLGRIAIPKVLPIMLERIQQDPDEEVRSAVVQSLRKIPSVEKIRVFRLAMRDTSPEVRRSVVAAYDDDTLFTKALHDKADIVFRQALIAITQRGRFAPQGKLFNSFILCRLGEALLVAEPSVSIGAAQVLRFFQKAEDEETRLALVERVIPALLAKCKDKDAQVRKAMIRVVSNIAQQNSATRQQAELKAVLLEALKDSSYDVRKEAIPGLASLGSPEALAVLRNLLDHGDLEYRSIVIEHLGRERDHLAVPALMKELTNPNLRYRAAVSLGSINDQSVVPQLLRWLEEERDSHRIPAIMALAMMNVRVAAPKLRQLLQRPPGRSRRYLGIASRLQAEDLRPYAACALGRLGDREALPDLLNLTPHAPIKLLFAQIGALRHFSQEIDIEKLLIQKSKQFSLGGQEDFVKKIFGDVHASLLEPLHSELMTQGFGQVLIYMRRNYRTFVWNIWKGSDDREFFLF